MEVSGLSVGGGGNVLQLQQQWQQMQLQEDDTRVNAMFSEQLTAARANAVTPSQAGESGGMVDQIVGSMRSMQADFRDVMGRMLSEDNRNQAFSGAISGGDTARANFEVAGVDGLESTLSNTFGDRGAQMYTMTRELMGTQLDVARVVVTEQIFSSSAGKLQKSADMLLRGQ